MQNAILYPKTPFAQIKADDEDIGLKVRYVGDEESSSVEVSSSGDITFKVGDAGSLAVDSTIDSGADTGGTSDAGVVDVSDDSSLTFGQVVDIINSSPNWEAFLVGVLRDDSANASTGSLLTKSATVLSINEEAELLKDTSKVLNISVRVGRRTNNTGSEVKTAAEIYEIISENTFGTGTNKIQVYKVDEVRGEETKIYEKAGGSTGSEDEKTFVTNGRGSIASTKQGEHLLVRMIGSAACTGYFEVRGATAAGN